MVTLHACINWKLTRKVGISSITVDVVVEADTASEATEELKATIEDLEGVKKT